jgi:Rrf2 family protein
LTFALLSPSAIGRIIPIARAKMRLSSLADYAVVMMAAAARHCGATCRLNATLLAERDRAAAPHRAEAGEQAFRRGLIESARGTGGGFRLARPPAAITVADIVEAIEGPIALTSCVDSGRHDCAVEGACRVKPHWNAVNGAVKGALAGISLPTFRFTDAGALPESG